MWIVDTRVNSLNPFISHQEVHSYLEFVDAREPHFVHELCAVLFGEASDVGDEGSDEQHVSRHRGLLLTISDGRTDTTTALTGQYHLSDSVTRLTSVPKSGRYGWEMITKGIIFTSLLVFGVIFTLPN